MNDEIKYSTRGSQWRRWDLHIHAPGTLHNDQFKGDWKGYIDAIENASPPISAIGITDYFSLNCYKETISRQKDGALNGIWLFPNVELRLDVIGKSWINFHLIFSSEDSDHVEKIEAELSKLTFKVDTRETFPCTDDGLKRLGRYHDPQQTNDRGATKVGAMQFKASLDDIERILESPWVRRNVITAVSGANGDGTSALNGTSSQSIRKRIESLADVIFSGNPGDRVYWSSPTDGRMPKPVVFSCDAHEVKKVLKPNGDKNCWIKGDVCFDTLKQILLEPTRRLEIGKYSTPEPPPYSTIKTLKLENSEWFVNSEINLNSGFVAIIGARGSGKTALADLVAMGAGIYESDNEDSFLNRAKEYLNDLTVNLTWSDFSTSSQFSELQTSGFDPEHQVKYLSQHFVNKLCSHRNQDALKSEIERIIFNSLEVSMRHDTNNFKDLESLLLKPHQNERSKLHQIIREAHDRIIQLTQKIDAQNNIQKRLASCIQSVKLKKQDIKKLINNKHGDPKEIETAVAQQQTITEILNKRELDNGKINQKLIRLNTLQKSINQEQLKINRTIDQWRKEYSDVIPLEDLKFKWPAKLNKDIEAVKDKFKALLKTIDQANPDNKKIIASDASYKIILALDESSIKTLSTNSLQLMLKTVNTFLLADKKHQNIFDREQKNLNNLNNQKKQLEKELDQIKEFVTMRQEVRTERRKNYSQYFDLLIEEERILESLYQPLRERLVEAGGTCKDLEFFVHRKIDVNKWIEHSKSLFDGRRILSFDLKDEIQKLLVPAWSTGDSQKISDAIDEFFKSHWEALKNANLQKYSDNKTNWEQLVAEWVFSVDHISLEYGIKYKGDSLEKLSSGTKGIVLLLLYLVIDVDDNRPLIIDQPEENLDPNSVFEELVEPFRNLCQRRQVIIVTHNPNLVVNTDVDQVIVANNESPEGKGLPKLSYQSGAIENKVIRDLVCKTLEGGEQAFIDREKRYRILRP